MSQEYPSSQGRSGTRRTERKGAVTTWRKTPPSAVDAAKKPAVRRRASGKRAGANSDSAAGHWTSLGRLHRQVARDALARILATPAASLMTIMVLGIALSLPAALAMTLNNLRAVAGSADVTSVQVSLYLDGQVTNTQALRMREDLAADQGVASALYISPQQGLKEFEQYSGLGEAISLLDSNPLPGVIEIKPVNSSPLAVSNLRNRLMRMGGVDEVRVDSAWLQRLNALLTLGDRVLMGLSILIVVAVLLTVGNTIRLLVVNRRDEVRVIKLVGGSDGFVMLPFLYSGFWYGLAGGVLAWLTVATLWLVVSGPASELAILYQSTFRPGFPGLNTTLLLVAGGALMGVTGALLASWKQLRDIDP